MAEPTASTARSASSTPSSVGYTFLVSESLQQTEPDHATKHDRFAHTRTKRKRTSAEDFTILEAEYQINAKPDRETRNSLADRVTLNEREIQVWFQNRRQMTRRKRHTWQPNEITSIIRSSQDLVKSTTSPSMTPDSSFEGLPHTDETQHDLDSSQASQASTIGKEDDHGEDVEQIENTTFPNLEHSQETLVDSQVNLTIPSQEPTLSKTLSAEAFTPRKLKRTSSTVRLAMSLDGKASVILRGQTPSPPNKPNHTDPLKRMGLQRSQSLVSTLATTSTLSIALPSLTSASRQPGRSRDTRNWEFWCDSERRESLTKSAQIDQRGSAAGPLSLLRSASSKQTNPVPKKRKSDEDLVNSRPKLSRTTSSHARLQSVDNYGKKDTLQKKSNLIYVDDNESDKENVDPNGPPTVAIPRHAAATRKVFGDKRQILQENTNMLSHSSSLGALLAKEKQATPAKTLNRRNTKIATSLEKENTDVDPEVCSFMNQTGGPRGVEDMNAVQNLLRLSQGAWQ